MSEQEKEQIKNQNRRRQADLVVRASAVLSVASWAVAFIVMILLDRAGEGSAFTLVGLGLLIFTFLCCIFAFVFNMKRMRRKTDKIRKPVIVMGIMSFIAIIIYVLRFIIL